MPEMDKIKDMKSMVDIVMTGSHNIHELYSTIKSKSPMDDRIVLKALESIDRAAKKLETRTDRLMAKVK